MSNKPIYSVKSALDRIEERIDRIEGKIDNLQQGITDLEVGQARIDGKLDNINKLLESREITALCVLLGLGLVYLAGFAKILRFF